MTTNLARTPHSQGRGIVFYRMLELPIGHDLVRYHDILAAGEAPKQSAVVDLTIQR